MPLLHVQVPESAGPMPLTLCGRRDIPLTLTGVDIVDATAKASESLWTVCPVCTARGAANRPA
jgi:hypothetical protein